MSFKNLFWQSIRGWLPEEPKMPKIKLKKFRTPIAAFVVATTFVSLFSSVFMFTQPAALLPPPLIVQSTPNSSYVELGGTEPKNSSFILILTDGKKLFPEKLALTFSVTEKSGNRCTAYIAVECDGFSNEASVDGSIVDGNLVIDSTRSIFLINPNLIRGHNLVLTETGGWRLVATVVSTKGTASTAIDPYKVTALKVSSPVSRTEIGWPISVCLGYDPTTGILVYSGRSLSDVLLKEIGIELLIGGDLKLVSYSDNLNLEVGNFPESAFSNPNFTFLITILSLLIAAPTVAAVHVIRKRRNRRKADALGIRESK